MPGAVDPVYIAARRVLLDALEALGPQRAAVILVGAQAIYLHTGDADLLVAAYTTDADIALDPSALESEPNIAAALEGAGFVRSMDAGAVGVWAATCQGGGVPAAVQLDLLMPESVGGSGRRAARLGGHGDRVARKVKGLEGALVDRAPRVIASLVGEDPRAFEIDVAGPAALLIAKAHKLWDRLDDPGRASDKDALDVLRLLRATPSPLLADSIVTLLEDERAAAVAREGIDILDGLFGSLTARGSLMAGSAAAPESPLTIAASCKALVDELLVVVRTRENAKRGSG